MYYVFADKQLRNNFFCELQHALSAVAMASVSVQNAYGVAMLSKSLDQVSSMGDQITGVMDAAAMELSVNPEIGANVDIRI